MCPGENSKEEVLAYDANGFTIELSMTNMADPIQLNSFVNDIF